MRCSFATSGEENEIAVWIADDEGSRAPRFRSERLYESYAGGLVLEKERLRVVESDRSREQLFRVAPNGINDRIVDLAKVQSRAVTEYLRVEGRFAIGKRNAKPEHP